MVPLSPPLEAHQLLPDRVPAVSVVARAESLAGSPLYRWRRLSREDGPVAPAAVAVAHDGAITRARNVAGALAVQRVAAPGPYSAGFDQWTVLGTADAGSGVALCVYAPAGGGAGEILLISTRANVLYHRQSLDGGVTWGAETGIVTEAAPIVHLAAAFRQATGNPCVFYNVGATVKRLRRTGGAWAAAGTAWTNTVAAVSGLAAAHDGSDFALLVTGVEVGTGHRRAWAVQMGDGVLPLNAWSALVPVAEADALGTVSFSAPALMAPAAGEYHGLVTVTETGAVPFVRSYESHPPAGGTPLDTWRDPWPAASGEGGLVALGYHPGVPGAVYAASSSAVFVAVRGEATDLSARLVRCSVSAGERHLRGHFELDDRDGGAWNTPGLFAGSRLVVRPGYASGAGGAGEFGASWSMSVRAVARATESGRAVVTVEAEGAWEAAARWRAPQSWQTAAGTRTRAEIAAHVCARAGLPLLVMGGSDAPSGDWLTTKPAFVLRAGETAAAALERLLEPVVDGVRGDARSLTLRNRADPRWTAVVERLGPTAWYRLDEPSGTRAFDRAASPAHGTYEG